MKTHLDLGLGVSIEGNRFMLTRPGYPAERVSNFIAWITKIHRDLPRKGRTAIELEGRMATGAPLPPIVITASELENQVPLWKWSEPGEQPKAYLGHKLRIGESIRLYTNYLEQVTGESPKVTNPESRMIDAWSEAEPETEFGIANVFSAGFRIPRLSLHPVRKVRQVYIRSHIFRMETGSKAILVNYHTSYKGSLVEVVFSDEDCSLRGDSDEGEILKVGVAGRPCMETHNIPKDVGLWLSTTSKKVVQDTSEEAYLRVFAALSNKHKYPGLFPTLPV